VDPKGFAEAWGTSTRVRFPPTYRRFVPRRDSNLTNCANFSDWRNAILDRTQRYTTKYCGNDWRGRYIVAGHIKGPSLGAVAEKPPRVAPNRAILGQTRGRDCYNPASRGFGTDVARAAGEVLWKVARKHCCMSDGPKLVLHPRFPPIIPWVRS
jgi:hypothetical protein